MHRAANHKPAGRQSNGCIDGQALAGEMNSLGAHGKSHIESIVDGQLCAVLVRHAEELCRLGEQ
jgi:hypothetical protein